MAFTIEGSSSREIASLWLRWPDARLFATFRRLLGELRQLCSKRAPGGEDSQQVVQEAFAELCGRLCRGNAKEVFQPSWQRVPGTGRGREVPCDDGDHSLQMLASALGMLMHFSADPRDPGVPINMRRPGRPNSTYPDSPPVAAVVASHIVRDLLRVPIPPRCCSSRAAERYADRALGFRVIDPSMESGQLLLAVALQVVALVHRRHAPGTIAAHRLNAELLQRLCIETLWGIDCNPLAGDAVRTVFSLLGRSLGVGALRPKNLLSMDALSAFKTGWISGFDGVINNPPWGELKDSDQRERVREFSAVEHHAESYVAFAEGALRSLRKGGVYGLVVPSQAIATRNSAGLRRLLVESGPLDRLIVLPRPAFSQASVRGMILLGRVGQDDWSRRPLRVTLYPLNTTLNSRGRVRTFSVPRARWNGLRGSPWFLLFDDGASEFVGPMVLLRDLAKVLSGVKLYHKGRGDPPQTQEVVRVRPFTFSRPRPGAVPAVRGRDVDDFVVKKPREFVLLGRWLSEVGRHAEIIESRRLVVRELCRRDGKMSAAVAPVGVLPLHGVLTVVPRFVGVTELAGVLNSQVVARYVRCRTASFSKVDFQRVTVNELRRLPIPVALISARGRRILGMASATEAESRLRKHLRKLASAVMLEKRREDHDDDRRYQLEALVSCLYYGKEVQDRE